MHRLHRFAFLLLFLLQCAGASALDVPQLKERVTDLAGLLTADQVSVLDSKLRELESTDSTQVAVLIIPSLEGEVLEDYSMRVVEAWKLGQKAQDNGALLFVSMKDRAIRIEVLIQQLFERGRSVETCNLARTVHGVTDIVEPNDLAVG